MVRCPPKASDLFFVPKAAVMRRFFVGFKHFKSIYLSDLSILTAFATEHQYVNKIGKLY